MFKIGNSKELPVIPDHLSDEGKDFVRQCLQRNPKLRPTATQLLEHPFVKFAASVEKPIWGPDADAADSVPGTAITPRSVVVSSAELLIILLIFFFVPYHATFGMQ